MEAAKERSREDPQARTTNASHAKIACDVRGDEAAEACRMRADDACGEDAEARQGEDEPYRMICESIRLYDEFLRQCDESVGIFEEEQRRERLMEQQSWFNRLKSTLGRIKQIYINKSKMKTE
jgi:hypothetical protein